jgi:hypothetical protein
MNAKHPKHRQGDPPQNALAVPRAKVMRFFKRRVIHGTTVTDSDYSIHRIA